MGVQSSAVVLQASDAFAPRAWVATRAGHVSCLLVLSDRGNSFSRVRSWAGRAFQDASDMLAGAAPGRGCPSC